MAVEQEYQRNHDLCHGCQMHEYSHYEDPDWTRKYIYMLWRNEKLDVTGKTEFLAVRGDITKDHGVQAIVNAANTSLLGGGGVDGAIHRAAGKELLAECRLLNGCKTGQAKLTKAYKLPCEYIIHTPGPHWNGGKSGEAELLASCYRSCLEIAVDKGIRSIAFPSISTGIYSYPLEQAAEIAVRTAKEFTADHPGEIDVIKWVLFDDKTLKAYEDQIEHWKVSEIVQAPDFYSINRMLRDGGVSEPEPTDSMKKSGTVFDTLKIADHEEKAVYFHKPEEPDGYLSNWYPSTFVLDGISYSSAEQYIMHQKCIQFGDKESADRILATNDTQDQQKIGRNSKGYIKEVWEGRRQVIAVHGLLAKFSQNEALKKKLLDTEDAYLVECAYSDTAWACGIRLDDDKRRDVKNWRGQNILGFALMEVRSLLKMEIQI